jgi:SnoaL-like domain
MPWAPELFTEPVRVRLEAQEQGKLVTVPYFAGLLTGELDALIGSFAGEPEVHHPVRGRIKGARAFAAFVSETDAWLRTNNVAVDEVAHVATERNGFGEFVLNLTDGEREIHQPVAVIADWEPGSPRMRIEELRIYSSSWPLTRQHSVRPPLLQPDSEILAPDVAARYRSSLAAGDANAMLAAFEPDGYAREPAGGRYVHRGHEALRAFYQWWFSNDGGIALELCGIIDDGRACAMEYNVVQWGKAQLPPSAGVVVLVRGQGGKLAAARMYDSVSPPLRSRP